MSSRFRSPIQFLLPRLGDILFLAGFGCAILLGPRLLNVDGDLGRHLVLGQQIINSGQIPTQDIFSHTMAGKALTPHEWLSEVIIALCYRWLGLNGVVLLCGLLIGSTFWVLYSAILERWGRPLLGLGMNLAALAVSSLHWLARPHLFTLLFFAIWLAELEKLFDRKTNRWWIFPILMLIWANLHGAFIAGFVTWGIYLAGNLVDQWREQRSIRLAEIKLPLAAGVVSVAASLLNPSGFHLWETSLGFLQNRYLVSHTAEYFSPDFHQISTWPFLAMLVLSILALGLRKSQLSAIHILLLGSWAAMGLVSVRNVPLFGLAAAICLSEVFASEGALLVGLEGRLLAMENRLTGWAWPLAVIVLVAFAYGRGINLDAQQKGNQFDLGVFPVAALDWLDDHPVEGPVFNYFTWGGYLLFREWPDRKVFIDGQTDFYGENLTRQYETVINAAPGWQAVLDRYGVRWVLIPEGNSLGKALEQSIHWEEVYKDPTAEIYVHKD
ncbi:MAG TPA: hypothetical protein VMT46_08095 [Anaerolineaceae bacterium]|nr:hypothetical protein [Anaerolineaceae bacterium]